MKQTNEWSEWSERYERSLRMYPDNLMIRCVTFVLWRCVRFCRFCLCLNVLCCVCVFAKRKFRLLMLFYIIHNVLLTVSAYCLRIVKIKTPTTTTKAFKQKQPHQLKTDVISPRFFDRNVARLLQRQSYQPTNTFPFLPSINRCRIFYLFLFPLSAKRKKYNI